MKYNIRAIKRFYETGKKDLMEQAMTRHIQKKTYNQKAGKPMLSLQDEERIYQNEDDYEAWTEYDHRRPDDNKNYSYSNEWVLVSNEKNPAIDLVKRGKYWYSAVTCTVETAKEILYKANNLEERIWASTNGFDLIEIAKSGKDKTKYHRRNVSFGVADYYYDYEF